MVRYQRKIKHRIAACAVTGGHVLDNLFVGFTYVTIGIDDMA